MRSRGLCPDSGLLKDLRTKLDVIQTNILQRLFKNKLLAIKLRINNKINDWNG